MLTLSPAAISKAIREKKKKMAMSEPEMVGTNPRPDMNAQDIYDIDKTAQIQKTVGSDPKINADETAMNEPYEQDAMSHEPMSSPEMPKDHGKMAYGGEMPDMHMDPMMPSKDMAEEIAGSSMTRGEMSRRIGEGFPSGGKGAGQVDMESEEMRRTKMRKMRLAGYLDGLTDF